MCMNVPVPGKTRKGKPLPREVVREQGQRRTKYLYLSTPPPAALYFTLFSFFTYVSFYIGAGEGSRATGRVNQGRPFSPHYVSELLRYTALQQNLCAAFCPFA